MDYIRTLKDGKSQIIKEAAFCALLENKLPPDNKPFDKLLEDFDKEVLRFDNRVTAAALSNAHGDWYEWILAIAAWNFCAKHKKANLPLLTPNISQFDIAKLYDAKLYNLIQDLRSKVLTSSGVQLISSNPDFVIVDRKLVDRVMPPLDTIKKIDQNAVVKIETAHKVLVSQCGFDDIHGYIGIKSSLRPDRRLQIPHEGSLMKAIYTHLQTREWIINPKGIKYYAIATKVGAKDRAALKTVATHSITTVHSIPQAAVDDVFEVNSLQQAQVAFDEILNV